MLEHCIHVHVTVSQDARTQEVARISEETTEVIQNQLLRYRSEHLPEVSKLELHAAGLSPDFNAIASALGECIVSAPELQSELLSLLDPYSEHQIAERLDGLGDLAIGAALALCHAGKDRVRVAEIAAEVNRIQNERGERLHFSPERVSHQLRKMGLLTRRLGSTGNGLLFHRTTQLLLHNVARAYGCVSWTREDKVLHCPFCVENKP